MALFSLNEDVLSLILTELTHQDARQLLTTCHAGYDSAMPYFLRKVEFNEWSRSRTLAPAERIRVFCEFMLADPDRRIPCLRVLWLDGFAFAETSARMGQSGWERSYSCPCHLSRVLRLATGLRELSLRHADELLAAVDRDCFFGALAALPSLDIIRLDGQPSACELLSRTMSRPRNLRVSSGGGTRPHRSGAFTGVHLPANLSECLLELHFLGSVILAENLYPAGIVFPRLRTLTARFGFCASLANIAGAFPNLCTLNLHKVTFAVDQPPAIWPSGLDCVRLEADPGLTPALPLACRVRRLELITAITQSENQPFFATLLNSLTPAILFLAVKHANVAPLTTEIAHVASGLKYLHLVLRSLDEELVASCAMALGEAALVGISFGYLAFVPVIHDDRWASSLAREVGQCIPSVAYVGFNLRNITSYEENDMEAITWYSIERSQRDQKIERLSWWRAKQTVTELLSLKAD